MSIDFEYANDCSGEFCTNKLMSRSEHNTGYCVLCISDALGAFKDDSEARKAQGFAQRVLAKGQE